MSYTVFYKKFGCFLFFFSTLLLPGAFSCQPEGAAKIYLSLHVAPEAGGVCSGERDVLIYHKGKKYIQTLSRIGFSLCIEDDSFAPQITCVVTTGVSKRMRGDKTVGWVVSKEADHAYYQLCYVVNNDGVSYHWDIEPMDYSSRRIPEDAIIIIDSPDHVKIKPFDASFSPQCPLSGEKCCGVVILPPVVINGSAESHALPLYTCDIDQYHRSVLQP